MEVMLTVNKKELLNLLDHSEQITNQALSTIEVKMLQGIPTHTFFRRKLSHDERLLMLRNDDCLKVILTCYNDNIKLCHMLKEELLTKQSIRGFVQVSLQDLANRYAYVTIAIGE